MANFDSPDLLSRFNDLAARPTSDEYSDAAKYNWLALAQDEVYQTVAAKCPHVLYGAPTTLTTVDSKTFTFGTNVLPMGHVELYVHLSDIPDSPLTEGVDYLSEGLTIRIPNDRHFRSDTIYARYVPTPAAIASGQAPSLQPPQARELIVFKAVEFFGMRGALRLELAAAANALYEKALRKWLLTWKTEFFTQGSGGASSPWWRGSPDLNVAGDGGAILP